MHALATFTILCSFVYPALASHGFEDATRAANESNEVLTKNIDNGNFNNAAAKASKERKNRGQFREIDSRGIAMNETFFRANATRLNGIHDETLGEGKGNSARADADEDGRPINYTAADVDDDNYPFLTASNVASHLNYSYRFGEPNARNVTGIESGNETIDNFGLLNESAIDLIINISDFHAFDSDEDNYTISDDEYLDQIRDFIFPKTWTWVLIFFHSIVFVIGLVGNTLVCVAVYRNHTMRTVTNYFIVNLAVADFLVILFCLPPSVIWDVTMTWFFGIAMCKIVLYLQTVSVTVSVLTLTFISIDRWHAICYPLKFKSTTGRAKTAICVIWLLALIFDTPEVIVYRTVKKEMVQIDTIYFTQCEPSWSLDTDTSWMILKMILLYAVPLGFMSITYCQVIRVLWRSGNAAQNSFCAGRQSNTFTVNMNTNMEGQIRSRIKAAKMLVVVVVMFAFCYFPVHLLSVLRLTIGMTNTDFNRAFALTSHWLCYANSAVNPIIYNFMSGKFRKEFRRAFDYCSANVVSNQREYELSSLYYKNTIKDVGSMEHRAHNNRVTYNQNLVDVQRLNSDYPYNERRSTKTSIFKLDV